MSVGNCQSLCSAPGMDRLPSSLWASQEALVQCRFPQNITWICHLCCHGHVLLFFSFTGQLVCVKNIDRCCSSSSLSPCACPYEDGATVKPVSGSPELFTSM